MHITAALVGLVMGFVVLRDAFETIVLHRNSVEPIPRFQDLLTGHVEALGGDRPPDAAIRATRELPRYVWTDVPARFDRPLGSHPHHRFCAAAVGGGVQLRIADRRALCERVDVHTRGHW